MLLLTWFDEPFRGTRDLDLPGYGDPAPETVPDVINIAGRILSITR